MTNSKAFSFLLGLLALSGSGCASVGGRGDSRFYPGVYPGVRNHAYYFPEESDGRRCGSSASLIFRFQRHSTQHSCRGTYPIGLFEAVPQPRTIQNDDHACCPTLARRTGACEVATTMEEVWSFRYSKPSLPEGPLVELSAAEMERHLLAQLDAPNADKADGLWQLARFHAESKQHDSFSVVGILARARPTRADEGRSRRLGCSLFGSQTFSLLKVALVPNLDFPERTLVVPK